MNYNLGQLEEMFEQIRELMESAKTNQNCFMFLANLPQGARVLTNEETEKILKNKKDYANLALSQTSSNGKQIEYNTYADGTSGLTQEDFLLNTEDLTNDFHSEELSNQAIRLRELIAKFRLREF